MRPVCSRRTRQVRLGGQGLDMRGRAAVLEEAGYSLLGPVALNIAAPDEGNVQLLEQVATEQQKNLRND